MSLGFLLPAGLLALASLLLPLLIHLARRPQHRVIDFAAMRWLVQGERPRRRLRFEDLPLLLDTLRAAHPGLAVSLRPAVGEIDSVVAAMAQAALAQIAAPEPSERSA